MELNRIPPASPTFNSDVETFHRLVEDEFYDLEQFNSLNDIKQKAYSYLLDFNYLRNNRNKDNKTPIQLLKKDYKNTDTQLLNMPVVLIDDYQEMIMKKLDRMYKFNETGNIYKSARGVPSIRSAQRKYFLNVYFFDIRVT